MGLSRTFKQSATPQASGRTVFRYPLMAERAGSVNTQLASGVQRSQCIMINCDMSHIRSEYQKLKGTLFRPESEYFQDFL